MDRLPARGYYDPKLFDPASDFLKFRSRYNFECQEIQDLIGRNGDVIYTEVLDLTVAVPITAPVIRDVIGRSVVIYGLTSATRYDPVANTGIETISNNPFVFARINDPRLENGFALKHNRGFRGDFTKLFLTWPAQSGVNARLVVHKFDANPWQVDG